jgi:hypothetical protein
MVSNLIETSGGLIKSVKPSVFGRNSQCQPVRGVNTREDCHGFPRLLASKEERTPEMNAIGHTHGSAASGAKAWEPMASSSANLCRKPISVHVCKDFALVRLIFGSGGGGGVACVHVCAPPKL